MTRQHVPGVSVAVARGGALVYARGFGYRNLDDHLAADANTRYEIESITKEFTAAAIMLLQQQGKLSIDDPVSKFIPTFPNSSEISLRQLLSHTSGVVGYTELPEFEKMKAEPTTPEAIVMRIAREPLAFKPGTDYQYSNSNYVLLGLVIERTSSKSFPEFIHEALFEPLGMSSSHYEDRSMITPDRALGYSSFFPGPLRHAEYWDPSWAYSAGGVVSTAVDLIKWDLALMSHRLISKKSLEEMIKPATLGNGKQTRYGLGIALGEIGGHRVLMHEGGAYGFKGNNSIIPELDLQVAVLGNSDTFLPESVVSAVLAALEPTSQPKAPVTQQRPTSGGSDEERNASAWIRAIQSGRIDRSTLQSEFNRRMSDRDLQELAESLARYGAIGSVRLVDEETRGPMTLRAYRVSFDRGSLEFDLITDGSGKVRFKFEPWQ